jgi:hypothetical protein
MVANPANRGSCGVRHRRQALFNTKRARRLFVARARRSATGEAALFRRQFPDAYGMIVETASGQALAIGRKGDGADAAEVSLERRHQRRISYGPDMS